MDTNNRIDQNSQQTTPYNFSPTTEINLKVVAFVALPILLGAAALGIGFIPVIFAFLGTPGLIILSSSTAMLTIIGEVTHTTLKTQNFACDNLGVATLPPPSNTGGTSTPQGTLAFTNTSQPLSNATTLQKNSTNVPARKPQPASKVKEKASVLSLEAFIAPVSENSSTRVTSLQANWISVPLNALDSQMKGKELVGAELIAHTLKDLISQVVRADKDGRGIIHHKLHQFLTEKAMSASALIDGCSRLLPLPDNTSKDVITWTAIVVGEVITHIKNSAKPVGCKLHTLFEIAVCCRDPRIIYDLEQNLKVDGKIPSAVLDQQDTHGNTVLHRANLIGNFTLVDWLLKHKANPHITNKENHNAFKSFSKNQSRYVVNCVDENGDTFLHNAILQAGLEGATPEI